MEKNKEIDEQDKKNKTAILILIIFLVIGAVLVAYSFYYLALPRTNATIVEIQYRKDGRHFLLPEIVFEYEVDNEIKTFSYFNDLDTKYKVGQREELILHSTLFSNIGKGLSISNNESIIIPLTLGLMFVFIPLLLLLPEQKRRTKADFQGLILGLTITSVPLCFIWLLIKILITENKNVFTVICCTIIVVIVLVLFLLGITTLLHYTLRCLGIHHRTFKGKLINIGEKNINGTYRLEFEIFYKNKWFNRPDYAIAYVKDCKQYVLNDLYVLEMPIEMKCDSINYNRKSKFSANVNALIEEDDIKIINQSQ